MSLMDSLSSMLGSTRGRKCPDCGCSMTNGECDECGYGSEDMDMEEESNVNMQNLLDLRDGLQNCMKLVDRIILAQSSEKEDDSEEESAPANTIIWSVQK